MMGARWKSPIDSVRGILGEEVVKKVGPIWGYDKEGEVQGCWRKSGQELWFSMGAYSLDAVNREYGGREVP
jgi:hypothetical protein